MNITTQTVTSFTSARHQIERFADVAVEGPLYVLYKPDGDFSLLTGSGHNTFVKKNAGSVTYANSAGIMEQEDFEDFLRVNDKREILDLFDPNLLTTLFSNNIFVLFPDTPYGPVIERVASPGDIAAYFFKILTRFREEERGSLRPNPSFTTIRSILETQGSGAAYTQEALAILESLAKDTFPETPKEDETGSTSTSTEIEYRGKRYICPIASCRHGYKRKGDLKHHVVKHHRDPSYEQLITTLFRPMSSKEGKLYPCPHESCRSGFKLSRGLARHMVKIHSQENYL